MIAFKTVEKKAKEYWALMSKSNQRGKKSINFVRNNAQWDSDSAAKRYIQQKETMTFNNIVKYLNRLKAQSRQLNFDVDVYQASTNTDSNNYESYDVLVRHWFKDKSIKEKFEYAFDKCVDFGYAVAEINYGRKDNYTLNLDPEIIIYKDPSEAFFDKNAELTSKIDGNFCGRKRVITGNELTKKYPKFKKIKKRNNILYDFWFRSEKKEWYVLLTSGIWYRQDLLSEMDYETIVERKADGTIIKKRGEKNSIIFHRYINGELVKNQDYPLEDLPLVRHGGFTYWTPDGEQSYPFSFYMEDPQKLINLTKSQVANNLKNSTATKYILNNEMITNEQILKDLTNINAKEGAFAVGGNPRDILVIPPTELSVSILNLSSMVEKDLESVAGTAIDNQMSDSAIISGKAIRELTNSIQMINIGLISEHILFIDTIYRLLTQMLPKIWIEQRTFFIKDDSGEVKEIGINILTDSGVIKNNIQDLKNNFMYEVNIGASTDMQKEMTTKTLLTIAGTSPQLFNNMADLFFKNVDIPDSQKMARRARAFIDPMVVKYGDFDITEEEFHQYRQQQAANASKGVDPNAQSAAIAAEAENKKAQADMINATTRQVQTQADIENKQQKIILDKAELEQKMNSSQVDTTLKILEREQDQEQKQIDIDRLKENGDSTN
jgi:hypothetical protein